MASTSSPIWSDNNQASTLGAMSLIAPNPAAAAQAQQIQATTAKDSAEAALAAQKYGGIKQLGDLLKNGIGVYKDGVLMPSPGRENEFFSAFLPTSEVGQNFIKGINSSGVDASTILQNNAAARSSNATAFGQEDKNAITRRIIPVAQKAISGDKRSIEELGGLLAAGDQSGADRTLPLFASAYNDTDGLAVDSKNTQRIRTSEDTVKLENIKAGNERTKASQESQARINESGAKRAFEQSIPVSQDDVFGSIMRNAVGIPSAKVSLSDPQASLVPPSNPVDTVVPSSGFSLGLSPFNLPAGIQQQAPAQSQEQLIDHLPVQSQSPAPATPTPLQVAPQQVPQTAPQTTPVSRPTGATSGFKQALGLETEVAKAKSPTPPEAELSKHLLALKAQLDLGRNTLSHLHENKMTGALGLLPDGAQQFLDPSGNEARALISKLATGVLTNADGNRPGGAMIEKSGGFAPNSTDLQGGVLAKVLADYAQNYAKFRDMAQYLSAEHSNNSGVPSIDEITQNYGHLPEINASRGYSGAEVTPDGKIIERAPFASGPVQSGQSGATAVLQSAAPQPTQTQQAPQAQQSPLPVASKPGQMLTKDEAAMFLREVGGTDRAAAAALAEKHGFSHKTGK